MADEKLKDLPVNEDAAQESVKGGLSAPVLPGLPIQHGYHNSPGSDVVSNPVLTPTKR